MIGRIRTYLHFIGQERKHNRELQEKAAELARVNQELRGENDERKQVELALQKAVNGSEPKAGKLPMLRTSKIWTFCFGNERSEFPKHGI